MVVDFIVIETATLTFTPYYTTSCIASQGEQSSAQRGSQEVAKQGYCADRNGTWSWSFDLRPQWNWEIRHWERCIWCPNDCLKLFRASAVFCGDCIRVWLLTNSPLTLCTLTIPLHFLNRSTPSGSVLQDLFGGSLEEEGRSAVPLRHNRNNAQGVSKVLTPRPPGYWLHVFTRFRHKSRAAEKIEDILICWIRSIRFSYFTVHY